MIYIEDLIERLVCEGSYMFDEDITLDPKDYNMINSFASQTVNGKGYTQKQADIAVRFCGKYKDDLAVAFNTDVSYLINAPIYRIPIRQLSAITKKIEIREESKNWITVQFPYDEKLVNSIREIGKSSIVDAPIWDPDIKAWKFPLTENNMLFAMNTLEPMEFKTCDKYQDYKAQIGQIMEKFEDFVPRLTQEGGHFKFVNTHASVPQPENMNFVESLFHAKRYGINIWDEEIQTRLKTEKIPELTKDFVNNFGGSSISINDAEHGIEVMDDIIEYATPTLLIIPMGQEILSLKKWYAYLSSRNIDKSEISVMFRTDNSNDKMFNDLVRGFGLNNHITENTKIVMVSLKLPKPIIKSGIKFNSVINLGNYGGVHYTLSSFVNDNPDVIYYNNKIRKNNVSQL
jgi:hypothetical protein